MSTEKTKIEKAGGSTPATPSKVEGTQNGEKSHPPLKEAIIKLAEQMGIQDAGKIEAFSDAVVNLNKQTKDSEIESLEAEHQAFKDNLKAEIEKIQGELAAKESEIISLKEELKAKSNQVIALETEHKEFKDKLKPEIEKIKGENKDLKVQIEKLQSGSGKTETTKTEGKFTVINSFRGNQDGEGIFNTGDDVSNFDADRLKSLVERELVKEG